MKRYPNQSSARTKLAARESYCLTLLFLFQCEGVNIVRSYVANQHWRVCRIKTKPKAERPCGTESLPIDNSRQPAVSGECRDGSEKSAGVVFGFEVGKLDAAIGGYQAEIVLLEVVERKILYLRIGETDLGNFRHVFAH